MNEHKLSIKNWSEDDRPREKMMKNGARSLSDAELIAILIGSGNRKESAVDLAKRILSKHKNSLCELGRLSVGALMKFEGIGPAKAITIAAALEMGRRRKETDPKEKIQITKSADAFGIFYPLVSDLSHEEFWVLLLDRSNKETDKLLISQGGVSGTVIDVRLILKPALEKLASGIILCHNHPSGNLQPSEQDIQITRKVKEAAKIMEMNLLDHIIIANNKYYSFADEGNL